MVSEVLRNKWVQAVGLLGAVVAIAAVLYLLSAVLVPLFFAFIVAYIFDPVIDKIETYKISRVGAIVTLVGSIVLVSILLPLIVLPSVIRQAETMVEPTADYIGDDMVISPEAKSFQARVSQKLEDWFALDSLVRTMNWDEDVSQDSPAVDSGDTEDGAVDDLNSVSIIRRKIGETVQSNVGSVMQSLFPQWRDASSSVIKMLGIVGDAFLRLFLFIGNFVLFAFVAIYLLKDYDHIVAAGDRLVPPRHQPKVREIMGRIDRQLRAFLRGQFTVCCCLGSMYAVGLYISGAPFALLLALLGALASFVPYLGLILTIGPAVILTILVHGIDWHLLGVLITFAVAQFLEGNFLTPKIVGTQVGLGPVWVILAIMVFSSTLGFIGLLLAVPIAAVLKVLAEEGLALYRESRFYSGDDFSASP